MANVKPGDLARVVGPQGQMPAAMVQVINECSYYFTEGLVWHCEALTTVLAPEGMMTEGLSIFGLFDQRAAKNTLIDWCNRPAGNHCHLPDKYLRRLEDDDSKEDEVLRKVGKPTVVEPTKPVTVE